jgi:hypothetical protein
VLHICSWASAGGAPLPLRVTLIPLISAAAGAHEAADRHAHTVVSQWIANCPLYQLSSMSRSKRATCQKGQLLGSCVPLLPCHELQPSRCCREPTQPCCLLAVTELDATFSASSAVTLQCSASVLQPIVLTMGWDVFPRRVHCLLQAPVPLMQVGDVFLAHLPVGAATTHVCKKQGSRYSAAELQVCLY